MPKKIARWRFWVIFRRLSLRFCVFIAVLIAPLSAYNFSKCAEFYLNTSQIFTLQSGAKIRAIHIGEGKYLAFSGESSADSAKYDAFMRLILFDGKVLAQKYDLVVPDSANLKNLATISENAILQGQILHLQKSLKDFGKFSQDIPPNAVISDICYQIYGIGIGDNRFIDSAYLKRFLARTLPHSVAKYSDIGFSIDAKNKIIAINPLMQKSAESKRESTESSAKSLHLGDEVLAINGTKIKNQYDFFDISSNLEHGKIAQITIKRNDKILQIPVRAFERHRAFDENSVALDILGIIVNENLRVERDFASFKKGDKILRLNQIEISDKNALDSALNAALSHTQMLSFLVIRDDFEFFIDVDLMEMDL
ncbi:DUF7488 domain-containing protein [Helicobacter sp. 23-1045]